MKTYARVVVGVLVVVAIAAVAIYATVPERLEPERVKEVPKEEKNREQPEETEKDGGVDSGEESETIIKKSYHPNGDLWKETPYVNGKIHGIERGYFDNHLYGETPYVNGTMHGIQKLYYQDARKEVSAERPYVNGKIHGTVYWYHEYGQQLARESVYINGVEDGPVRAYHEDGSLSEKFTIVNNKIHGKSETYDECGRVSVSHCVEGECQSAVTLERKPDGDNPLDDDDLKYVSGEIIIAYNPPFDVSRFKRVGKSYGPDGVKYYIPMDDGGVGKEISKEEYCSAHNPVPAVRELLKKLGVAGKVRNTIGSNSEVITINPGDSDTQWIVMEELQKLPVVDYVQLNHRYEIQ